MTDLAWDRSAALPFVERSDHSALDGSFYFTPFAEIQELLGSDGTAYDDAEIVAGSGTQVGRGR